MSILSVKEYAQRVVSEAPPLSDEQAYQIARLLNPYGPQVRMQPTVSERDAAINKAEQELARVEAAFRSALDACRVCDVPQPQHQYAVKGAIEGHSFMPLSVDEVLRVSHFFKGRIDSAQGRLEGLR